MRITTENIRHPGLQRERISDTSKFVVVEGESNNKVKILIAQTYRTFRNGDFQQMGDMSAFNGLIIGLRTPDKSIYEAHLAISVDILVRNFRIVKNRYHNCLDSDISSDVFLNDTLWLLCHQILRIVKPIYSEYEVRQLMSEIISVVTTITGEPIFFINGKWKTHRDMWLDRNVFIKRRTYKHNFVDARVS